MKAKNTNPNGSAIFEKRELKNGGSVSDPFKVGHEDFYRLALGATVQKAHRIASDCTRSKKRQ
ncbi:MAG: hypothetical protein DBX39_00080 [Bacillota bacterium]|nr:MAG: hypothetical protein DBX39_00080 [Bacillota bacterium]